MSSDTNLGAICDNVVFIIEVVFGAEDNVWVANCNRVEVYNETGNSPPTPYVDRDRRETNHCGTFAGVSPAPLCTVLQLDTTNVALSLTVPPAAAFMLA